MGFSRKALKARAKVRKDAAAGCEYVQILREGENAYRAGQSIEANPYTGEDAEIWEEGYIDARETK
jgi:hypothetical protein